MGTYFLSWSPCPRQIYSWCCFVKGWMHEEVALSSRNVHGDRKKIIFQFARNASSNNGGYNLFVSSPAANRQAKGVHFPQ